MRVLCLADHLGHRGGGVHGGTTYFETALPSLRRAGVDIHAGFLDPPHPAAERLRSAGVEPTFLARQKWDPRAGLDLLRLVRRLRPAVLHLHSEKSILLGRLVGRQVGVPAVIHLHDALKPKLGPVQRRLTPGTASVVVISDALTEHARADFGASDDQIEVVHYGRDLGAFAEVGAEARTAARAELGIPGDAVVVALIGRVVREKGQRDLLAAAPQVLARCPAARFLVIGTGPDLDDCVDYARSLGITDRVWFTGQRDDVPAMLAASDLTAMPSRWVEGFGWSALESIAAGRPVVAYRSGGIPVVVQHEETGLLVESADVDGLASAAARLAADPNLRRHHRRAMLVRRWHVRRQRRRRPGDR